MWPIWWQDPKIETEKWTDEITDFLHIDTDSQKSKADQKFLGQSWSKNGCGQSGHGTLTLTVSQKWTYGINRFLHAGANSGKLKVDSMIFRRVWQKMAMAF